MKVFMLTTGCYSDYDVEGIFSTRERAEIYRDRFPDIRSDEDTKIHEIEIDPLDAQMSHGLSQFVVSMERSGDSTVKRGTRFFCDRAPGTRHSFGDKGELVVDCWAIDESHAAKIASEIRARLVAENRWPKAKE